MTAEQAELNNADPDTKYTSEQFNDLPLLERLPRVFRNTEDWKGYLGDSQLSATRKTQFAKSQGYSGVMIWEAGQDKQDIHVSMSEQIMRVANGSNVISHADMLYTKGDYSQAPSADQLGSIRERRKRKREEEKIRLDKEGKEGNQKGQNNRWKEL